MDVHSMAGTLEDHTNDIDKLKNALVQLQKTIDSMDGPSREEFDLLKTRVENLEKELANLRRLLGELNKKVNSMQPSSGGADPTLVQQLQDELNKLR